jgi:triacylglycerol esterase/lipase EstA (alpha/beta hydrolase family)
MLGFLLTLAVAVLILLPMVRYACFLASNARAGELEGIRRDLGGLVRPLLSALGLSLLAEAAAVLSYPLGWFMGRKRESSTLPVVLVHGLYHNGSAWLLFARRLRRAGFTDLHTYQYNSFTGEFDQAVDGLRRELDRLLGARPGARVMLVGHSLGGLVCRAAAGDPQYSERVAALVTLGSPHAGSELARLGGNAMARGLIPGRAIPAAVAQAPDPECPKLSLYTLVDDFVFPLSCLRTGRPGWDERAVSPMSHVSMLYSREVASLAAGFLAGARDGSGEG